MIVPKHLRDQVGSRAKFRCEYCLIPETGFAHQVDHIIALKHGGQSRLENLAYACLKCNRHKGSDLTSLDANSVVTPLFHPRTQKWSEHFALKGATIEPLSREGEATVLALRLNDELRVERREGLIRLGLYPSTKPRSHK